MENLNDFPDKMARLRHTREVKGKEIEYWSAREIQPEFGYDKWDNFLRVIEKAIENCSRVRADPKNHFAAIGKMIPIGKGALREQIDYVLSRTACYLIALNGESTKPEISWAKAYFVAATQVHEDAALLHDAEERKEMRAKLRLANWQLSGTAKSAGVTNFAYFNAAGIRALYEMSMLELKAKKGVPEGDDYWDYANKLELSASEFKAQLTAQVLVQKRERGEEIGQKRAEAEHSRVGKAIRETVFSEIGTNLEDLPIQPSLKKILGRSKRKSLKKPTSEPSSIETPPPSLQ